MAVARRTLLLSAAGAFAARAAQPSYQVTLGVVDVHASGLRAGYRW